MRRLLAVLLVLLLLVSGGCVTPQFAVEYSSDGDYTRSILHEPYGQPGSPPPLDR